MPFKSNTFVSWLLYKTKSPEICGLTNDWGFLLNVCIEWMKTWMLICWCESMLCANACFCVYVSVSVFILCPILFQQQRRGKSIRYFKKVTCINMRLLWAIIKGHTFCLPILQTSLFFRKKHLFGHSFQLGPLLQMSHTTTVLVFHL